MVLTVCTLYDHQTTKQFDKEIRRYDYQDMNKIGSLSTDSYNHRSTGLEHTSSALTHHD